MTRKRGEDCFREQVPGGWTPRFEEKEGLGEALPWEQQERKPGDGACFKEEAKLPTDQYG